MKTSPKTKTTTYPPREYCVECNALLDKNYEGYRHRHTCSLMTEQELREYLNYAIERLEKIWKEHRKRTDQLISDRQMYETKYKQVKHENNKLRRRIQNKKDKP